MIGLRYIDGVASLKLVEKRCVGCGLCQVVCPHGVFVVDDRKARLVDRDACIECGACARNCPTNALEVKPGVGCATAVLRAWLAGGEPSCDCGSGGSCC